MPAGQGQEKTRGIGRLRNNDHPQVALLCGLPGRHRICCLGLLALAQNARHTPVREGRNRPAPSPPRWSIRGGRCRVTERASVRSATGSRQPAPEAFNTWPLAIAI